MVMLPMTLECLDDTLTSLNHLDFYILRCLMLILAKAIIIGFPN